MRSSGRPIALMVGYFVACRAVRQSKPGLQIRRARENKWRIKKLTQGSACWKLLPYKDLVGDCKGTQRVKDRENPSQ